MEDTSGYVGYCDAPYWLVLLKSKAIGILVFYLDTFIYWFLIQFSWISFKLNDHEMFI